MGLTEIENVNEELLNPAFMFLINTEIYSF